MAVVKFSLKALSSKYVAKYIVKRMLKNKFYIVPGIQIKLVGFFAKTIPENVMAKMCYNNQTKKYDKDLHKTIEIILKICYNIELT